MWPKFLRLYEVHDIAGINRLSKSLVTRMLIEYNTFNGSSRL